MPYEVADSVLYAMVAQLITYFLRGHAYVVLDVPLLIEAGMHRMVRIQSVNRHRSKGLTLSTSVKARTILVIVAPTSIQVARIVARDGISEEDALARVNSQMSNEEVGQSL